MKPKVSAPCIPSARNSVGRIPGDLSLWPRSRRKQTDNHWNVSNLKVPQYSGEISLPATSNRHALALLRTEVRLGTSTWPKTGISWPWSRRNGFFSLNSSGRGVILNEFLEAGFPTWLLPSFYLAAARRQRSALSSLPDLWRQI